MAGSSIFVTYGLKSGGGPAFLRRTRTAFGQEQTRERTSSSTRQWSTRTGGNVQSCSTFTAWDNWYPCSSSGPCQITLLSGGTRAYTSRHSHGCSGNCGGSWTSVGSGRYPDGIDCSNCGSASAALSCIRCIYGYNSTSAFAHPSTPCTVGNKHAAYWGASGSDSGVSSHICYSGQSCSTVCRFPAWGTWTNGSCSPTSPGCSVGAVQRQCRDLFSYGGWSGWSNTASCTTQTAGGQNVRECQTIAEWENFTDWEEVDVCNSSLPSLTVGATEIQCMAT